MASEETVTLTRTEYDALISRNDELEDRLAALDADDGARIPHEVALAIIRGRSPVLAFRNHLGLTLRELSARTGICRELPVRDRAWTQERLRLGLGQNRKCSWHNDRHPCHRIGNAVLSKWFVATMAGTDDSSRQFTGFRNTPKLRRDVDLYLLDDDVIRCLRIAGCERHSKFVVTEDPRR